MFDVNTLLADEPCLRPRRSEMLSGDNQVLSKRLPGSAPGMLRRVTGKHWFSSTLASQKSRQ
jgi:hypothetical protein